MVNDGNHDRRLASRLLLHFPRYQEVESLGCGSNGYTVLALDKDCGDKVAIKILQRTSSNSKYVEREASILKELVHPHIILLKEVLEWQDLLGLVMEYASGGTLYSVVLKSHGLPEADARWYFQQIVMAIDFCHQMGIACRDVKLENVLLISKTTPLIKLCDFGCSKDSDLHSPPGSLVGTPVYLAPEVALLAQSARPYNGQTHTLADGRCVVSGRVTICHASSTLPLWKAGLECQYPCQLSAITSEDREKERRNISLSHLRLIGWLAPNRGDLEKELQACIPMSISTECRELLLSLLQPNPDTRFSIQDVIRNSWFLRDLPENVLSMNKKFVKPKTA